MKNAALIPIDIGSIHPECFGREIGIFSSPKLLLSAAKNGEISANDAISFTHRAYILHWLIKLKWDSQHQLPKFPKGHRDSYRVLGALYKAALDACQQCHSAQTGYIDAGEWFRKILVEAAIEGPQFNKGKKATLKGVGGCDGLQRQNKLLSCYENPFDQEREPHTWHLIEVARQRAEGWDIFRSQVWTPLVQSRKRWSVEFQSDVWRSLILKGGELYEIIGQGNQKRRVEKVRLPEPLHSKAFRS